MAWLVLPLAYSAWQPHQRNLWLLSAVVPGMLSFIMLLLSGTKIHLVGSSKSFGRRVC